MSRLFRTGAAALALSLGLAMALPAEAQWTGQYSPVKPGKNVELPTGAPMPPGLFKRTRKDDIHGATKVVIPYFQVQFITASKTASHRSFGNLSQAMTLEGIDGPEMQAMADALYDKFVADLTAQGLTVLAVDQARGQSPALAKILGAAKPAPFQGKTSDSTVSTIVSAHGTPVYFHQGDPSFGSMANLMSRAYWDQPQAATELGAALVGVRISVNFVAQENNDKRGFMGMRAKTAKVSSEVGLSIEPVSTHFWIQRPNAKPGIVGQPIEPVRYYLTSQLDLPDDPLLSTEETTTRGQKRSDFAASAVGILLGGAETNRNKSYAVAVDPTIYIREVGGAMGTVEAAMAAQVKADLVK